MILDSEHIIYLINSIFMFSSFIYIFFSALTIVPMKRIFHYFLSQISITSSICYLMLASNTLTIQKSNGYKIYNAKYIDWIINTPLQLIILAKMGKLSYANIYILSFLAIIMVLYGWLGEINDNEFKWIFFAMGMIPMYPIYIFLFEDFDYQLVKEFSGELIAKKYYWMGKSLLSIWFLYPFVWCLDNLRVINKLFTAISYTIFDFLSKVVFTQWIFYCVKNSNYVGETIVSLEG